MGSFAMGRWAQDTWGNQRGEMERGREGRLVLPTSLFGAVSSPTCARSRLDEFKLYNSSSHGPVSKLIRPAETLSDSSRARVIDSIFRLKLDQTLPVYKTGYRVRGTGYRTFTDVAGDGVRGLYRSRGRLKVRRFCV
jgi:hypothetical protein